VRVKELTGKIAVVTGAGSGIGRATALALAEAGMRVAVTDLDIECAREVAGRIGDRGGTALACALDVRDQDHVQHAAAHIGDALDVAAVLVNNAGIGVGGHFLDTTYESWQEIIAVNLLGVVHGCRAFVPGMVAGGGGGHVVNVASMLGYTGIRGASAYCTTKFGVLGFSESLRAELAGDGIGVSTICPGLVRTNIINAAILESPGRDIEGRRADIQAMYEKRNFAPERVAAAIVKAIRRNRAVVPVAPEAWATYYLKRWAPGVMGWTARRGLAGLDAKI
jgi:NAD(P)-dependent dehydrogenase (short-subunit alcohol dehydrogenase family)